MGEQTPDTDAEQARQAGWTSVGPRTWTRRLEGFGVNAGLVIGDHLAALIDTGSGPAQAAELHDAVRAATDLPLVLINTHAHGDHFFGNAYFRAQGAGDIWAHAAAARDIAARGEQQRALVTELDPAMAAGRGPHAGIVAPNRLVEDKPVDLDLGGHTVTLFHLGRGHTDGDLLVGSGPVLFAGDLVEEGAPPSFEDSFPHEWQKVLGKLIAIDELYESIVPGHGAVVDTEFVRMQFHKLRQAITTCSTAIQESSADYTKAVPVLPYGPVQSRHLILRMKATGNGAMPAPAAHGPAGR
jgi:glyoxylase-like metal-dependent hydrolase (beta-lactamase superfamily II)